MAQLFDDKPWFAPKSYGLGSGLPIAWQGWVLLGMHLAAIGGITLWLAQRPAMLIPIVLLVAVLPMPLYAAKTRGGWRWRWGRGD